MGEASIHGGGVGGFRQVLASVCVAQQLCQQLHRRAREAPCERQPLPRQTCSELCLQVEAKYPALLFKQQLDAFVQKIFPMLRDNIKKDVNPQLAACIHAPRAPAGRPRRQHSDASGEALRPGHARLRSHLRQRWAHSPAALQPPSMLHLHGGLA